MNFPIDFKNGRYVTKHVVFNLVVDLLSLHNPEELTWEFEHIPPPMETHHLWFISAHESCPIDFSVHTYIPKFNRGQPVFGVRRTFPADSPECS